MEACTCSAGTNAFPQACACFSHRHRFAFQHVYALACFQRSVVAPKEFARLFTEACVFLKSIGFPHGRRPGPPDDPLTSWERSSTNSAPQEFARRDERGRRFGETCPNRPPETRMSMTQLTNFQHVQESLAFLRHDH